MFSSFFRKLFRKPSPGQGRRPRSHGFRPSLETLEDRTVPAFLAPVSYGAGLNPTGIAVGDYNGDGKSDLAIVNSGPTGTVGIMISNGDIVNVLAKK